MEHQLTTQITQMRLGSDADSSTGKLHLTLHFTHPSALQAASVIQISRVSLGKVDLEKRSNDTVKILC